MEKNYIDLQLFADETQEAPETGEPKDVEATEAPKEEQKEEAKDEKKYTDAELDEIINKKFAKWREKSEAEKAEAAKIAKMNEAEKQKYELEKLQKETAELKDQVKRSELSKKVSSQLRAKDIEPTDDVLGLIVTNDEEQTDSNLEKFVTAVEATVKAREEQRAKGKAPKNYGQNEPLSPIQAKIEKWK